MRATGFDYQERANGSIAVTRGGTVVTMLRGGRAARFLAEVRNAPDPQLVMARWTGNDKQGNERTAKIHARHRLQ